MGKYLSRETLSIGIFVKDMTHVVHLATDLVIQNHLELTSLAAYGNQVPFSSLRGLSSRKLSWVQRWCLVVMDSNPVEATLFFFLVGNYVILRLKYISYFVVLMLGKGSMFCVMIRTLILVNNSHIIAYGDKVLSQCRNMDSMPAELIHFWLSVLITCSYACNYQEITVQKDCVHVAVIAWWPALMDVRGDFRNWLERLVCSFIPGCVNQTPYSN